MKPSSVFAFPRSNQKFAFVLPTLYQKSLDCRFLAFGKGFG